MNAVVVKRFHFDAAHYLPGYDGPCSKMHGHRWEVEVGVSGEVQENGMVMDFADLKQYMKPVIDKFDHSLINDYLQNPTAENIAWYIKNYISSLLKLNTLKFVRVWETSDSMVEVCGSDAQM